MTAFWTGLMVLALTLLQVVETEKTLLLSLLFCIEMALLYRLTGILLFMMFKNCFFLSLI